MKNFIQQIGYSYALWLVLWLELYVVPLFAVLVLREAAMADAPAV